MMPPLSRPLNTKSWTIHPLDASTWAAFAEVVERNNGIFGGCRVYDKDAPPVPDWRITCFYVDKKHRGQGIARAALEGALDQIAQAGGGLVEAIPEVTAGREAPGRFLFRTTVELFEEYGSPAAGRWASMPGS